MKGRMSACIRVFSIHACVFMACAASFGPAWAEALAPGTGFSYVVEIQGVPEDPPEMKRLLGEVSHTVQEEGEWVASTALLRRRAEADMAEMKTVLRSFGYFRAHVVLEILPGPSVTGPDPDYVERGPELLHDLPKSVIVQFRLDPGPRFTFGEPSITLTEPAFDRLSLPALAEAGILEGAPYAAAKVLEAEKFVLNHYKNNGYPFPRIVRREVRADFAVNRVEVRFEVMPGPYALFGETRVTGLARVDPEYVYGLIPWSQGAPYDVRLVDKARRILFETNLFGMVEIVNPGDVDDQERLPITVRLTERAPRTIRLGMEYTTDYGPGISGNWTHRNLLGKAEKLTAGAVFNSRIRTAFGRFDKPMFLGKENALIAQSAFNDETTDAYDARSVDGSALVKRQFTNDFSAGGGLGFRCSRVKEKTKDQRTSWGLAYLPLTATYDTREDLLNPTRGCELSLAMAPYQDVGDGDARFFRYLLSGSTYFNFSTGDKVVFAVRAAFGQIYGMDHDHMPADLRFYAGGGGSIRGYAYQLAGPVQGNVPLGGLSVLTFSLELRFRISDSIGLVPFLDGGTAFLDRFPDFADQDILYGAGLGLRYFTVIGPIRLDVAVPLDKRKDLDDSFQLYVSIGQAF